MRCYVKAGKFFLTALFVFAWTVPYIGLAFSQSLGPVDSTVTGQDVPGGTYYNTPGGQTTFQNLGGNLWVKSGTTVAGLECDPTGTSLTGNGGHLHFYAPGSVVRVGGNINVNALMNNGAYIGNGGRVTVTSAYLYQNGNTYGNGKEGGRFNV